MFDIGWSELVVIAVVALIAIGPKELPGVLRMVGQWMGKARKMAAEFQGQFQEAMREAEMADLKKSFDEVKEAASRLQRRQHHDFAAKGCRRRAADRRHRQAGDVAMTRRRRRAATVSTRWSIYRRCAGDCQRRRTTRRAAGNIRRSRDPRRGLAAAGDHPGNRAAAGAAGHGAAPDVLKDAKAS